MKVRVLSGAPKFIRYLRVAVTVIKESFNPIIRKRGSEFLMKYISEKGTVIYVKEPSQLRRTLSFRMNHPSTFDSNKMAKIIANEGEGYIKELRFLNKFKHADGKVAHAYDVIFEIPHCKIEGSRMLVNKLMVKIEERLERDSNVSYTLGKDGRQGRHKRDWMDEEWIQGQAE
jgi:hypothetical protein